MQTADQGLHTISKDVKLAVELAQNLSVLIAWLVGSTAVSRRFRQWMGGMAVKGGMVDIGSGMQVEVTVAKTGVKIVRISPHLMILPFPVNEKTSGMSTKYETDHPGASWVMAAKTPIEHVMVHFSEQEVRAMMNAN